MRTAMDTAVLFCRLFRVSVSFILKCMERQTKKERRKSGADNMDQSASTNTDNSL